MRGERHGARRGQGSGRIALLSLCTLLASSAVAQSPEGGGSQAGATAAPSSRPASEAHPLLADIGAREEVAAARLRAIDATLTDPAAMAALQADVLAQTHRTVEQWAETDRLLGGSLGPTALESLASSWHALRRELVKLAEKTHERVARREADLATLAKLHESWALTVDLARKANAPAALLERAESTLGAIDATSQSVEPRRAQVLLLADATSRSLQTCDDALAQLGDARSAAIARLFADRRAPVWRRTPAEPEPDAAGRARDLASELESVRMYVAAYRTGFIATAVLGLLLILQLRRPRSPRSDDAAEGLPPSSALRTPVAAAFVLTLVLTTPLRPDPPFLLQRVVLLVGLATSVVVLRALTPASLLAPIYCLAALLAVRVARETLPVASGVDQVGLMLEMAAATTLLLWAALRLREAPPLVDERLRSIGRPYLRVSALACGAAAVAAALGYVELAGFVATGVLYLAFLLLALVAFRVSASAWSDLVLTRGPVARLNAVARHRPGLERGLHLVLDVLVLAVWLRLALWYVGLLEPARELVRSLFAARLQIGALDLPFGHLFGFVAVLVGVYLSTRVAVSLLEEDVYSRMALPRGVPYALSTLTRYGLLLAGFLLALGTLGFDLGRVALMLSALGLGIGFGLQSVINNFVSGLILLFERPIQVGDTVQKGTLIGQVRRIGIRSSMVRTFDGAEVIVPNANLVAEEVVNWTLSDRNRRIDVEVGVAYGSDLERVLEILRTAAVGHAQVLSDPPPEALFKGFGESSLDFELRVWTRQPESWMATRSDVGVAIGTALGAAGIAIPFPQRDLHLVSIDEQAAARLRREPL